MSDHITRTAGQTLNLGVRIAAALRGGEILALHGPLGAGKTVLAKGIARGLGITEVVTSPTYTIVSEYEGTLALLHADLYRISDEDEYEQLALDELLNQAAVLIIEWPERAGAMLPAGTAHIHISISEDSSRIISGPEHLMGTGEVGNP